MENNITDLNESVVSQPVVKTGDPAQVVGTVLSRRNNKEILRLLLYNGAAV